MNTKNQWCTTSVDLPDNDRNVLVYTYNYPDAMIGFYSKENARWSVCDKELDEGLKVAFWMDLPENPKGADSFSFKEATETRQFSQEVKNFLKTDERMRQMLYVQNQITNAATAGKDYCYIDEERMTDDIFNKLEYAGYGVIKNGGNFLINW